MTELQLFKACMLQNSRVTQPIRNLASKIKTIKTSRFNRDVSIYIVIRITSQQ